MSKKITFLGIETSCDETAAAVIRENEKGTADVLSNVVSSQIEEHKEFGGVVPELAARAHLENIEFIIDKALKDSKTPLEEIDGVAATAGPGLIVCLTVGLNIGKSIAAFSKIEYCLSSRGSIMQPFTLIPAQMVAFSFATSFKDFNWPM